MLRRTLAQHTNKEHGAIDFLIEKNVEKGSYLMTDDARIYEASRGYIHRIVNHSAKQYVNGMAHTNTIEGFWSHFKRGIDGIYHQISFKHLQRYAHEFSLRYNSRKFSESGRFNMVLANMVGRLTYKELIANGR